MPGQVLVGTMTCETVTELAVKRGDILTACVRGAAVLQMPHTRVRCHQSGSRAIMPGCCCRLTSTQPRKAG